MTYIYFICIMFDIISMLFILLGATLTKKRQDKAKITLHKRASNATIPLSYKDKLGYIEYVHVFETISYLVGK